MNTNIQGGARIPVHIVTDAELAERGWKLRSGYVMPVEGVTLVDAGSDVMGGAAIAVYLVSAAQIAERGWKLGGGIRIPVCTAPASRPIMSHVVIPVYDPDGAWEA